MTDRQAAEAPKQLLDKYPSAEAADAAGVVAGLLFSEQGAASLGVVKHERERCPSQDTRHKGANMTCACGHELDEHEEGGSCPCAVESCPCIAYEAEDDE